MNLGGLNEEETFFLEMPLAFLLSKRGRPHFGRLAAIMTSRSIFKHSAFKFTEFDVQILVKLPGFLQVEVHWKRDIN